MSKLMPILLSLPLFLSAATTTTCKMCHPAIYKEYKESIHANSSIYKDPIFNAVWKRHPLQKKGEFKCAKCHTPNNNALIKRNTQLQPNTIQRYEPISCQNCHQIESIHKGKFMNKNIYNKKRRYFYSADVKRKGQKVFFKETSKFFGLIKSSVGSPYHDIDYSNENYYNGNACLGCHAHKKIQNGFEVCSLEVKNSPKSKETCISCHMPKTLGSFVNLKNTSSHANHDISLRNDNFKELAKYIDLTLSHTADGFQILIKNHANHALFVHPLRLGQLRISLNKHPLKVINFHRIIGNNGKATLPWLADTVLKDTTLKAFESRTINMKYNIQKGDSVEVTLGYYLITPKAAQKLGITNKKLLQFRVLKRITNKF